MSRLTHLALNLPRTLVLVHIRKFGICARLNTLNQFGVPLLPEKYNRILFHGVGCPPVGPETIATSQAELEKFGLNFAGDVVDGPELPDLIRHLPQLEGDNVLHHFHNISTAQLKPYLDILDPLLHTKVTSPPTTWRIESGWTRYSFDGSVCSVDYPLEPAYAFDVEVSVRTDPRAVMAVACSHLAWYSWLSPHFLAGQSFPTPVVPESMIPLGSDASPRLVIGHNVSYDRIRVGDEYRVQRSGTRYLDTMSLHIAHCGMTSSQRMLKQAESKLPANNRPAWMSQTSKNNLADVYSFHCRPKTGISKNIRESFVKLTLPELRDDVTNLLSYCAQDVFATLQLSMVLIPKFMKACPHPATFTGVLNMSTSFLPTNNCWNRP